MIFLSPLSWKRVEVNEEEIELKLNKEKQKLIRLVAIKENKTFSKSKKENYKIGAVICNQKWKNRWKIQSKYNFCTPIHFLTSTEFFLPSQNLDFRTKSQPLYKNNKVNDKNYTKYQNINFIKLSIVIFCCL